MRYKYPQSHTPVDHGLLAGVLSRYEGADHQTILEDLEKELAILCKRKYAVALASGTASIHLALKALGVQAGDEVVVPTFTYIGSVGPVLYEGATPLFVDSEAVSWNLDPNRVEACIKDRLRVDRKPKVLLVVHTYGMPGPMRDYEALARHYGMALLEDAAEAIGSTYAGEPAGHFGEVSVLSFNNNKTLTAYGGGVLLTDDKALASDALFRATQSREPGPYYTHAQTGYNYRMSILNAAMCLGQLGNLSRKVELRRQQCGQYDQVLRRHGGRLQGSNPDAEGNRWLPAFAFSTRAERDEVRGKLEAAGIETRYLWKPMHQQPLFAGSLRPVGGEAERLFDTGLSFPAGEGGAAEKALEILSD